MVFQIGKGSDRICLLHSRHSERNELNVPSLQSQQTYCTDSLFARTHLQYIQIRVLINTFFIGTIYMSCDRKPVLSN